MTVPQEHIEAVARAISKVDTRGSAAGVHRAMAVAAVEAYTQVQSEPYRPDPANNPLR